MAEAGVPVAWVTTGTRAWLGAVPTIAAEAQPGSDRPVRVGRWTFGISRWSPAKDRAPVQLAEFVRAVLAGDLVAHRVIRPARDDWSTRPGWSSVWATPKDVAEEAAYVERQDREAEEARRAAEADEQRRLAALSADCDRVPGGSGGRSGPTRSRPSGKYKDFNEFEILARIWPAGAWIPQE
ncbi:hypothetical protein [Streptomyces sp. CBMA156]|uniref:hypothetical protein n=1 Tax=Streptomyces sp. CBMA156 TaxID=1930280 RepID=UPI001661A8E6|nr:hypothetical protein [Streptomyces sp. CBMA156]MBD0670058.1 hypothetical protein [Streptomyces sp. CBMA156]